MGKKQVWMCHSMNRFDKEMVISTKNSCKVHEKYISARYNIYLVNTAYREVMCRCEYL